MDNHQLESLEDNLEVSHIWRFMMWWH